MKNIFTVFLLAMTALLAVSCSRKPEKPVSRLILKSVPEGAAVVIREKEPGRTPLKLKAAPNTYIIKFSLEKYKDHWEKIELKQGEQKEITAHLVPETASVMITSSPAAEVEFQGKKLGMTPVVINALQHGSYKAELFRYGFSRQSVVWKIDSAVPQLVKADLTSNMGTLQITSKPNNAEVVVDGKVMGRTPFKEQVEEGRHSVQLRRNGYVSVTQNVDVKKGTAAVLSNIELEVKTGSIRIVSNPVGARVFVNGSSYGNTPFTLKNQKPGTYNIRLEKEGFDPVTRKVNLPAGSNLDVNLKMDSNTGGVDIITQPAGVALYLDGKPVGISEKDPASPGISKKLEFRNLSMGEHQLSVAHKRGKPQKKTIHFQIKKGEIVRLDNVSLWIPDTRIIRKNGETETGRMIQVLNDSYLFGPAPGVQYTINKNDVSKVETLKDSE